ncbi:MAG: class I SAM-dependent methyltransferase [Chlamydiales bacterium]|nr:class I SAM-dependent methyltransferase [Chlamydiales bacterium]
MTEYKAWIKNVFDRASSGYGEKGCSFFDYFGERLVELVKPSVNNNILDVATGKGAVLFPAAKIVGPKGRAVGIDLSSKMIREATKNVIFPWIELYQMDAEHLLFPNQSFDIVFCAFALFFFPNIAQALSDNLGFEFK